MKIHIPTADEVKALLSRLSHAQMQALSKSSDVPFTTLWKIRTGETKNPGIETVGLFFPLIKSVIEDKATA